MNTELLYVEVDLADVLNYYIKGYSLTDGCEIIKCDSFVDSNKEKVIFKMYLTNNNN